MTKKGIKSHWFPIDSGFAMAVCSFLDHRPLTFALKIISALFHRFLVLLKPSRIKFTRMNRLLDSASWFTLMLAVTISAS
ncbi:MAG: hypothetical protein PHW40_04475, partial [Candidatus Izemoplasmatales bacterium]|nr:hypothetical protein [Candidatus Izemoplasmatales bacterium]